MCRKSEKNEEGFGEKCDVRAFRIGVVLRVANRLVVDSEALDDDTV